MDKNGYVPKTETLRRNKLVRTLVYIPMNIKNGLYKYFYRYTKDSARLREFKDKYKGKRCFIIGNGPSLSLNDLERLDGEYTFCCNMLYKLFENTRFRPNFYVVADPNFFPKYMKELLSYDIDYFFVSRVAKKKMELPENVYYFNASGPFYIVKESMKNGDFSGDASKYLALSYTVTYYSIQLAVYMGFSEIILMGVDHKYAVVADERGRIKVDASIGSSHAAGLESSATSSLQAVDSTTFSYITAKSYCDKNGIKIINATRGGALEVFDRADIDELLDR